MSFKEINVGEIGSNTFEMIGKQWMLVTAAKSEREVNTMTASWGGLGIMWGKPVAFVFIRPQRYTREFIEGSDTLSLSFFDASYRKMLSYMGSVSGRDENKIEKQGLTVEFDGNTPYFKEADMVLKAKKLYVQDMSADHVIDTEIIDKWYPQSDWHTMYVVEIEKVLVKE